MSVDIRSSDRRRYMIELQAREKEIAAGLLKASRPCSPKAVLESEKRIRREIANSNERRRMQCINAGFSSLRALIPQLEGDKLSKAAILQHATEYISSLEMDKSRLQKQLDHSNGLLMELGQGRVITEAYESSSPPPSKRKKRDTESSDEGVCSLSDGSDDGGSDLQQMNVALRHQMELERLRYLTLEEQFKLLEAELFALLRVRACRPGGLNDLDAVEHEQSQSEYQRQVVACRETVAPTSVFESFQPPQPVSPTLDQAVLKVVSPPPPQVPAQRHLEPVRYSSAEPMDFAPAESENTLSSPTTTALLSSDQHSFQHHNYCHRDHPRRRHRQQAQLEQQRLEEEEHRRQRQAQQEMQAASVDLQEHRRQRQEQEMQAASVGLQRPKQNTQNLQKLVEAIRQIEGDRVLCTFYDEEHTFLNKHRNTTSQEMERETSSVSDQDELKSENSGHSSPPHLHHQHNLDVPSDKLTTSSVSASSDAFSEKYPHASLHLHPTCYRPGVIVHKQ